MGAENRAGVEKLEVLFAMKITESPHTLESLRQVWYLRRLPEEEESLPE
jgi:hypothetical protein